MSTQFTNNTPLLLQTSSQEILLSIIPLPNPTNHPDVIWVNVPNESISIEMTRSLQQNVITKPYSADFRVFVLQNLELTTVEAQQALLKLFEEPPKHIRFILTTQYPAMILPTILSRVQVQLTSEAKTGNATELHKISFKNLADRLNWAAQPIVQENPVATVLTLLSEQLQRFEQEPTGPNSMKLKKLQRCLDFLRAKTNPKLALEWLALHF